MDDLLRYIDAAQAAVNAGFDTFRERLMQQAPLGPSQAESNAQGPPAPQFIERPDTWKQAVLDVIAAMPQTFRFSDVYRDEEYYSKNFPDNRSIMQTIAGVLRELVKQGVIQKVGSGEYRRLDDPNLEAVDTVVVPARAEGFLNAVIDLHKWWAVRLHSRMISKIKYIAFYRVAPVSAITHIATVSDIIRDNEEPQKYQLLFDGAAQEIGHVRLVPGGKVPALRNIRYTTREKLLQSTTLEELWPQSAEAA